jgi:NAD+ synthase (glutamine-hydrolysing)
VPLRLAIVQLNFTVGAFDANYAKMAAAVGRASDAGANLVVFSELAATGYPPRDLLAHERFIDRNLDQVARLATHSSDRLAILVGFVDRNTSPTGKALHNAVALCRHGRVVEVRHKSLLPTYDVFDEDRYFEPARLVSPIDLDGVRLGVTICEDVWNDRDFWPKRMYHRDPVEELAAQGADLFINISASPFVLDKADVRRRMIRQEAVSHHRYFFYVNQVGGNDEIVFDGHSIGIDPQGDDVLRAAEFDEDFLVFDVPLADDPPIRVTPAIRPSASSEEESAYRALVMGIGDYARKCGFTSAVLGLSGGIDSAVTACLAAAAFGPEQVLGVAMPTRYSSAHSLSDAAELATRLGIAYQVIPIDAIYQAHLDALAAPFEGLAPDTSEENIQARIRGAVLMAFSNKRGSILLSTGNKSELAVGYCTLYGDMCGGLAAISDVPKTLVYRLAEWINRDGNVIPESSIAKAPSAELRPDQKDTDSLPPYDVLDPIIRAYVEDGLDATAIAERGFDQQLVLDVLRRVDGSEYKRRQAAPGIKISSKAFGVGRRYPIAADYRFARELHAGTSSLMPPRG